MSKPRFPLSVVREFKFRSVMDHTGTILECDNFKDLYRHSLLELRVEVGDHTDKRLYKMVFAQLSFGYEVIYEERPGYSFAEWHELTNYGTLYCSQYDIGFVDGDGYEQLSYARDEFTD